MSHKRLYIAAAIIAGVVLLGFLLSVPRAEDGAGALDLEAPVERVPVVTIKDSFKKGVHTLSGTVTARNACATVSAEARAEGEPPSAIVVALTLTGGEGVCLQVPTELAFSTTVSTDAELPIRVTVNGKAVQATP